MAVTINQEQRDAIWADIELNHGGAFGDVHSAFRNGDDDDTREMRERIKARFDFEGIEIPYPQRVVWHRGEDAQRDGQPQDDQAGQLA